MGGIVDNPQVQNAINFRPQQPRQPEQFGQQPQQPGQVQPQLNDPLNRGGMPFQGFNPAGTDAGPRPFVSPNPLQPFNSNQVYAGGNPNFNEAMGQYNPIGRPNVVQPGPNVFPQPQPQGPQQRGLGGLQLNKFRNRLS